MFCIVLCVQGVQLDDCTTAAHRCECSDTDPVCPRCGGARQSRDPVGVASVGVTSVGVATSGAQQEHVTQSPPTSHGERRVFEAPPTAATAAGNNVDEDDEDKVECLQRLHSTPETANTYRHHHHPQPHRSFSTVTANFSVLPTDVGGVSVRSAPDSAVPEVVQSQGGQRSKLQRFFEPLKRSKSTGNHKDATAAAAAQASLYDPTRQHIGLGLPV